MLKMLLVKYEHILSVWGCDTENIHGMEAPDYK